MKLKSDRKIFLRELKFALIVLLTFNCLKSFGVQNDNFDSVVILRNYHVNDTSYFEDLDRLLDSKIEGLKYFCVGEIHRLQGNYVVFFNIFKYLNQRIGTKSILMEAGSAFSYYANKFLSDGDSGLHVVCINMMFVGREKEEISEFFYKLKILNDSKSPMDKIVFHSIDPECFTFPSISLLYNLCNKDKDIPFLLSPIIAKLNDFEVNYRYRKRHVRRLVLSLRKSMIDHESLWERYLGDDFRLFVKVLRELYFTEMIIPKSPRYIREELMASNFNSLVLENPKERFYIHMGNKHVTIARERLRNKYTWDSFLYLSIQEGLVSNTELISFRLFYNKIDTKLPALYTRFILFHLPNSNTLYNGIIIMDIDSW